MECSRLHWAKLVAHNDNQYMLEQVLSQVASDVAEVNRLPARIRRYRRFDLCLDPSRFYFSVVRYNERDVLAGRVTFSTVGAAQGEISVAFLRSTASIPVRISIDSDEGTVMWVADTAQADAAGNFTSELLEMTLPEFGRWALESFFFGE